MNAAEVIRGQGSTILSSGIRGVVSVFSLPNGSTWHIPAAEAAVLPDDHPRLARLIQEYDLYISPGVRPEGLKSHQAGLQSELVGLLAFGVDVDSWSTQRAHDNLPKRPEDVEAIVEAASVLPSMVVKSGTGSSLHAWWIFDKAEPIRNSSDLARLRRASKKFHEPMLAKTKELGFHLDSSHKLLQWLRLPGSKNRKFPDNVQDVEIIWTGREYSLDELYFDSRRTTSLPSPSVAAKKPVEVLDAVVASAKRIRPGHEHKDRIEKILRGESFAESGDRDEAMFLTVSTIIFSLDRREPLFQDRDVLGEALVDLYTPSFKVWAAEPSATKTLEERIEKFVAKIVAVFEQRDEKDEQKAETEQRIAQGFKNTVELRRGGVPVEAEDPSTTIIQHKNAYYIHNFGRQDVHPLPSAYYGPFLEKEVIPALSDFWENCPNPPYDLTYLTDPTAKNPNGTIKQKTVPRLIQEYGSLALEVLGDLSLTKSYFDLETRVFNEAICPVRDLEPVFDPVFDEYLQVAFGHAYDKFVDYLSYFLRLDVAIGAPYIEGFTGAGKGALVAGLSRFWGKTGPTDYERVAAADFNAFKVPFIVLDEGLTTSRKTSAHIRHLISTGAHTINPKNFPKYVVNGYVRVMFTANNKNVFSQITSNEELSEDDIDAIARRFIYFRMSDETPQWLADRNEGKRLTNPWVEGDVIAKHVLWLNQNRQSKVVPGKRFVVEGESSEVHRALVTRGDKRGLVLEWLSHFATNPSSIERFYATQKKESLAVIGNGQLLVNTRAVSENWTIYGEKSPCLTTTMIGRILGQISTRVRLGHDTDSGFSGIRYHNINFDHVLDWAGGDAQVGDLRKMRENFDRKINV